VTPEENALRDAFLAECWPVVRATRRGSGLSEWAASAAVAGFASCRSCGVVFRQPTGLEVPWILCPECAQEAV
jgi:hypothetical protein